MNLQLLISMALALGAATRGNWSPCGESLQAQIHPLGETSRGQSWWVTISCFTLGSVVAGSTLGAAFGAAGTVLVGDWSAMGRIAATAGLAVVAGSMDLSGVTPWTPKRQVNENWIGRYRGWVYGAAFGVQLGLGFSVFVMSWAYYAMLLAALLSGSTATGALVGASFGLGRGLLLYLSYQIKSPEDLSRFHRTMARRRTMTFRLTGLLTLTIGLASIIALV